MHAPYLSPNEEQRTGNPERGTGNPHVFIPMHAFGYTEHFQLLRERISRESNTRLFLYRDCGDSLTTDIHPLNA
ncbi:MAG: hypothetical protein V5A74_10875 [Desulfohalobiaceae bacterium]